LQSKPRFKSIHRPGETRELFNVLVICEHPRDPRFQLRILGQFPHSTSAMAQRKPCEKTDEFASEPAFQFFACSSASLRLKKALGSASGDDTAIVL
jgi:hypothetical protein